MDNQKDSMVSIIGSAYFEPIADLIERMTSRTLCGPSQVQAGHYENGYSASIIILLVAMFESYVMRSRYINREKLPIKRTTVVEYLKISCEQIEVFDEITEIFILRDLIFHNHLWELEYSWQEEPSMLLHGAKKEPTSGDRKYEKFVDPTTRKTRNLKLNAIPIKVDRSDVYKVFSTLWSSLICLEKQERTQCYVSHIHIRFRKKTILFSDLIEIINGPLTI